MPSAAKVMRDGKPTGCWRARFVINGAPTERRRDDQGRPFTRQRDALAYAREAERLAQLGEWPPTTRPPRDGLTVAGFYVYVLWGADPERPLYVGQSTKVFARLAAHLAGRFKDQVTRVTFQQCAHQRELDRVEAQTIRALRPTMNQVVKLLGNG